MGDARAFPGWWQVLAVFLVQAVTSGAVMTSYSVAILPFATAFEPSRMVLMLGMTGMIGVSGLISPWLGTVVERRSIRRLMLLGALGLACGYLALSFTTSMLQVLLVYTLVMSVATALTGPLATATLLARWFHRRRGLALGVAAMGASVGGFLFPPLLQGLIDALEWRHAFRLLAAIILAVTLPAILVLVVNRPGERGLFPDGAPRPPADHDGALSRRAARFASTGALLRSRNFWIIATVMGLLFAAYMAVLSNFMPFAGDRGITPDRAALLLSVVALLGIVGKLCFGAIADEVDLRVAMALALLLLGGALACLALGDSFGWLLLGSALTGIGAGAGQPLWAAAISHAFGPENQGRAMGLMMPLITLFNLIAPPAAGFVHDLTGSYLPAFLGLILLLVVALTLTPFLRIRASLSVAGSTGANPQTSAGDRRRGI